MAVIRIFVEKKPGYDVEAEQMLADLRTNLLIGSLSGIRILNRYDIEGLSQSEFREARDTIFSEPNVDTVYDEQMPQADGFVFAVEYLPGQYDQRADSAAQCCQLQTQKNAPLIRCAKVYILQGELSEQQKQQIVAYTINPVEARSASLEKPESLELKLERPADVAQLEDFIKMDAQAVREYHGQMGFAMTVEDLLFVQDYFKNTEKRAPYLSELKVIDTYWSDHCRHTTFLTKLEKVEIEQGAFVAPIREAYELYLSVRENVYAGRKAKDITLMDLATIAAKEIRKNGGLKDLDESEEINACSVVVQADMGDHSEKWLVMFKNETHNHPTEIEPFGGAATCLGGAIRDPLSGRSYVYQAMRVTGAGDPLTPVKDTLKNKLPQRKITQTAAAGYSSYGNQIGLATGQVQEIYDEGYVAKRLEIGAVVGAAPFENVRRDRPAAGDIVVLLGGATGRDGCGGATGSSKAHTAQSLSTCGSEVQKGNPPTERKLQRLFRDPAVSKLIKRCNDFGAGGVCVAIGELSEGLDIELDAVPKKYEGLDGTELAISESQERMAVVLAPEDVKTFVEKAHGENLNAAIVATVTDSKRLRMTWRGTTIVDIARSFLDTNGVTQHAEALITAPCGTEEFFASVTQEAAPYIESDLARAVTENLKNLNVCSQKGLSERFDATIGKGTVLMPFGGKTQLTPAAAMAAKLPVLSGKTNTATVMAWGYNPALSRTSPFHGAYYAVVESLCKMTCAGADISGVRVTQQEYFERLHEDPARWGKPAAALLGSFKAQLDFNAPSIGGKDSMSGSFESLDVPPTLVNFAITVSDARTLISPEFKKAGSAVGLLLAQRGAELLPNAGALKSSYAAVQKAIESGKVTAACPVGVGGVAAAVCKMCMGNLLGAELSGLKAKEYFTPELGAMVLEADEATLRELGAAVLGTVTERPEIRINGAAVSVKEAIGAYLEKLDPVFPVYAKNTGETHTVSSAQKAFAPCRFKTAARPRVIIPVFPGTNCEVDTARTFTEAGAECEIFVLNNLTAKDIEESTAALARSIAKANILMLPGGFSGGDEPDGSGKFIATVLRNAAVKESVLELLYKRDGLAMGICNGFQALIKTGLLPYGDIRVTQPDAPTLTFNTVCRHISTMAQVRVSSVNSPWMSNCRVGEVYTVALSHGEGRFVGTPETLAQLEANGQILTQYVDAEGNASMDGRFNYNGSMLSIEGILSPDGRILGKMGHAERAGAELFKNIPGEHDMRIFEAGVNYFK